MVEFEPGTNSFKVQVIGSKDCYSRTFVVGSRARKNTIWGVIGGRKLKLDGVLSTVVAYRKILCRAFL